MSKPELANPGKPNGEGVFEVRRPPISMDTTLAKLLGAALLCIKLGWVPTKSARTLVVHGDGSAGERIRRDQLEPSGAG
jgi:hypothetical protein